jgi:thioredoxin 1
MAASKMEKLDDLTFDARIAAATLPVLVDFTAAWCGPCRAQAPILEKLAAVNPEVLVVSVDVDESPELAARFGIRGMPTLIAFRQGKETGRRLGLTSEKALSALIETQAQTSPALAG